MSNVLIEESTLKAIADAIREKSEKSDLMLPYEMPTEIQNFKIGNPEAEKQLKELIERNCTEFTIPDGVSKIGAYAFAGCTELSSIDIPSGVTAIGDYAFKGCTSLSKVVFLGEDVTDIASNAFEDCPNLTYISIPWPLEESPGVPPWGAENARISFPEGKLPEFTEEFE